MKNQAFYVAVQAGLVAKAEGIPGITKTKSALAFSRAVDRPIYVLIGSNREPGDVGGWPFKGDNIAFMEHIPPGWAARLNERPSYLFIDEGTDCPPAIQSAIQGILSEKKVGDLPLRPDTWMSIACNPPEVATNGFELGAAFANRCVHLKWEMDWDLWDEGLLNGLDFPDPKFPLVPTNWRNEIPNVAALVVAFRRHRPTLFEQLPAERSQRGGAWPSPRSWTMALEGMAAAAAAGVDESVGQEILAGCVGHGAASEFFTWREELDLPDPQVLLDEAIDAIKKGAPIAWKNLGRPDKVLAALSSVNQLVVTKSTKERWHAALAICEAAGDESLDIALACAGRLAKPGVRPKGAEPSRQFVTKMLPVLSAALKTS